MITHIQKWGNSLAIRIPRALAEDVGLARDATVDLRVHDGQLVLTRVIRAVPTLDELLDQVTLENLHSEIPTGLPLGNEAW